MRFTFLGTAPGKSLLGKSHASYLLERDDKKFLIDCGEGTTQRLLEKNMIVDELDFIIISHLHPDHVSGIFMLLQTLYINKRKKDLFVFLPEAVEEFKSFMERLYIFSDRFSYHIHIQKYTEQSFKEIGVYPFRNKHLIGYKSIVEKHNMPNRLLSYSFKIEGKRKSLILSSDISSSDDIAEQVKSCEIIVLDGIHPSFKSVQELLNKSKTEVYITHGDYANLQHKYADLLNEKTKLARENDEIIF